MKTTVKLEVLFCKSYIVRCEVPQFYEWRMSIGAVSDTNQMKSGGKSTSTLSSGATPLLKTRLSSSHPDLSSLHLLQSDNRPNYPEHCLKVFKSDHSCRYLLIHKVQWLAGCL